MLIHRIKSVMGNGITSFFHTFIARGIAALGGIFLFIILGRLYGPEGIGVFALAQSIYLGAAMLARYGMNNSLMRYVGEDHKSNNITIYLKWACKISLILSFAIMVLIFIFSYNISQLFDAPNLLDILPLFALAVPALTISFLFAGFMKGVRKPASACLMENGSISLVASALLLIFDYLLGPKISNVGYSISIASWAIVLQGLWQILKWQKKEDLKKDNCLVSKKLFLESSHSFFIMSLANFIQNVLSVLIAGWLLNSVELGFFRSAERTALLIVFILQVIEAILPPRFARQYRIGDIASLKNLAQKGALVGVIFSLPLVLLCIAVPGWVLNIFGTDFHEASNLLRILVIAQLINVATGSVGFILNMTGHEKIMRNIALICSVIGLVMFFVLIPVFGALGAAIALSLVLIMQNIAALFFVRAKLGIWVIPTLSAFKK